MLLRLPRCWSILLSHGAFTYGTPYACRIDRLGLDSAPPVDPPRTPSRKKTSPPQDQPHTRLDGAARNQRRARSTSEQFDLTLFAVGKTLELAQLSLIVEAAIPELSSNRALAARLVADLEAMRMLSGASLNVTMTAQGLMSGRSSPLGKLFLRFISDPEAAA
jgi:hypothetical protein